MSVLERCPSYRESNKGCKERRGTNSRCQFYRGVRLIAVSVKRESTVPLCEFFCFLPMCYTEAVVKEMGWCQL